MVDAPPERFEAAIGAIDAANAEDPDELVVGEVRGPKELVHARMMTDWVQRLDPDADELQLLAARAHHFRRWTSPRSDQPPGRSGYLRWRTAARRRHAEEVGALLAEHGYDAAEVARVQRIVRKQGLGADPAVQVHEDALCLVFLQTQLADVAGRLGDDATIDVLVRTIRKMGPAGIAAAADLDLDPAGAALLTRALGVAGSDEDLAR